MNYYLFKNKHTNKTLLCNEEQLFWELQTGKQLSFTGDFSIKGVLYFLGTFNKVEVSDDYSLVISFDNNNLDWINLDIFNGRTDSSIDQFSHVLAAKINDSFIVKVWSMHQKTDPYGYLFDTAEAFYDYLKTINRYEMYLSRKKG